MPPKSTLSVSRFLGRRGESLAPLSLDSASKEESAPLLSTAHAAPLPGLKDVPGPRPSLPFVGTAWQYFPGSRYSLSNLHESSADKFRRYGPIVREEFQWRRPVIQLSDPQDFETVFRYQGQQPERPISEFLTHYRKHRPDKYESAGLANTVGEEWERTRKILSPILLKAKALDFLVEGMNGIGDDFATLLRRTRHPASRRIDDMQDLAYRLALEGVYMMSLDTRLGCLEADLHQRASDMILSVQLLFEAFQELFFGLPIWKFYETLAYKKLDKAESLMYEATSNQIQETLEKIRNLDGNTEHSGVLHTLLQTKAFSDKELKVTIIDILSGGIFTVANSISFLVYHLSNNPEVQEKLYREVKKFCPESRVTNEGLSKMPYVKACVKEAFRLTPTIPCITRILREDVVLSGYLIPAGTPVFCNFPVPCRRAEVFPDPDRFVPDRWLTPRAHNPFALLPFGFGQRMCVGRRFAEMEMYVALIKLVYNFKLESTGEEVKSKSAFLLVPSNPVSIIFKDRQ